MHGIFEGLELHAIQSGHVETGRPSAMQRENITESLLWLTSDAHI